MITRRRFIKKSAAITLGVTLLDVVILPTNVSAAQTDYTCSGSHSTVNDWDASCSTTHTDEACGMLKEHTGPSNLYPDGYVVFDQDQSCNKAAPGGATTERDQSCGLGIQHPSNPGGITDSDQNCGKAVPYQWGGNYDVDEACRSWSAMGVNVTDNSKGKPEPRKYPPGGFPPPQPPVIG